MHIYVILRAGYVSFAFFLRQSNFDDAGSFQESRLKSHMFPRRFQNEIFLIKQHYHWLRFWDPESCGLKFLAFMTRGPGQFIMMSKPASSGFFFDDFVDFRTFQILKNNKFLNHFIVVLAPTLYRIQ